MEGGPVNSPSDRQSAQVFKTVESIEDGDHTEAIGSMVSESSLKCRVSGLDHSNLAAFGIPECPKCQDIIPNPNLDTPNDEDAQQPVSVPSGGDTVEGSEYREVISQLKMINKEVKYVTDMIRKEENDGEGSEQEEDSADAVTAEVETAATGANKAEKGADDDEIADHFVHQVDFRDCEDPKTVLQTQTLKQPFKFVPFASKQPVEDEERTIAQISTSVTIRHLYEKKKVKTGFLDHPGVQITLIRQSMQLKSRHLIKALRDIVMYYPSVSLYNRSVSLSEPFCILAHYMPELEAYRDKLTQDLKELAEEESDGSNKPTSSRQPEDKEHDSAQMACRHINKMLAFLKSNIYKQNIEEEQARYERADPVCTFPMLWLLYKPGSTVYVNSNTKTEAYIVEKMETDNSLPDIQASETSPKSYELHLWNLSFDGEHISRKSRTVYISSFENEWLISDLAAVPARFIDQADGGKTRSNLVERGRKWYGLIQGAQQQHYVGEAVPYLRTDSSLERQNLGGSMVSRHVSSKVEATYSPPNQPPPAS